MPSMEDMEADHWQVIGASCTMPRQASHARHIGQGQVAARLRTPKKVANPNTSPNGLDKIANGR